MAQALPCEVQNKITKDRCLNLTGLYHSAYNTTNFDDNPEEKIDGDFYQYDECLNSIDKQGIKKIAKNILAKRQKEGKL